ncbi:MAG TPA: translation elongation factor Ts [Candidatus Saccharimonadales bacterium]|nr:translation elongation factor Ts [Candidatus Saccharimonadales bacterium]
MAKISIDEIKRLRELTGVGITDAKQALQDASGDFDKALEEMRKKGLTKAEKRGEREARAGLIGSYSHDGRIGVLVEVNCETDFVAKTDEFKELVKDLTLHIAASEPQDIEELLAQEFVKDPSKTVGDIVKQANAKLGENIIVRRFSRMALGEVESS